MKLTKVFQTKGSALREAFKNDDLALMEKLMGKKSDCLLYDLFDAPTSQGMTPRMANLFVEKATEGKLIRWNASAANRPLLPLTLLASHALATQRYDVLDVLFDGRIDYCGDDVTAAIVKDVVTIEMDADKKSEYLKKLLSSSKKLPEPDAVVAAAIEVGNLDALDILAASGIDLCEKNEYWLREAAKTDKKHVCLHLVEKHGASIERAQKAAEDLGTYSVFVYLESLRQETCHAEDAPPPTVESLSREVRELRTAMRELTALVRDLQAEKTIDKSVDKPGLQFKGRNP